jgi:hypothetical protein
MQTIYSNLVQFRITPNEIVFEFSSYFPEKSGQGPPSDLKPDVRVVLQAMALDKILAMLEQAKKNRDTQQATQKPSVGFKQE